MAVYILGLPAKMCAMTSSVSPADRKAAKYSKHQSDRNQRMSPEEFKASIAEEQAPPLRLSAPLAALWWDGKGDWARAHALVNELVTVEGMAVHAYLHRKEGSASNADYWYQRSGRGFCRAAPEAERAVLIEELLSTDGKA
jgi:hypothetical protein